MKAGTVTFKDPHDLIEFANLFLVECRLRSLTYDVERCLRKEKNGYAPIPALMFCLSVIDLLGALYAGDASKNSYTSTNSKAYLKAFFNPNYTQDAIELLWDKMFRHKIMHLSMPQTAIYFKNKIVSWNLHEEDLSKHMEMVKDIGTIIIGNSNGKIKYDHKFVVNIDQLKEDIRISVCKRPDGYLHKLESDINLQKKFKKAINEIYQVQ